MGRVSLGKSFVASVLEQIYLQKIICFTVQLCRRGWNDLQQQITRFCFAVESNRLVSVWEEEGWGLWGAFWFGLCVPGIVRMATDDWELRVPRIRINRPLAAGGHAALPWQPQTLPAVRLTVSPQISDSDTWSAAGQKEAHGPWLVSQLRRSSRANTPHDSRGITTVSLENVPEGAASLDNFLWLIAQSLSKTLPRCCQNT